MREEPPPALRELPRIPEPDFSALDQLFRSQGSEALFAPEKSPAKAAVDLDDDPWPPEADDPPAAIVSSDTDQEEDPEVEEEDIEAWEAELTEMEQPAAAAEPEPPEEFSFFRRIETRGATALNLEPMPIPVIDPPRPIASTATSWPLPKPVEQRSILPRPELARVVREEMPRPIPVPPPVARAEPVRPAPSPVDRQEPVALGTSPLLDRLAPLRPVPPAAPALKAAPKAASVAAARPERPPSRPGPRVNDPTVTMTRDEKLSMFS